MQINQCVDKKTAHKNVEKQARMNLLMIANFLIGMSIVMAHLNFFSNKCNYKSIQINLFSTAKSFQKSTYKIKIVSGTPHCDAIEKGSFQKEFNQSSRNNLNNINRTQSTPIDIPINRLNKIFKR